MADCPPLEQGCHCPQRCHCTSPPPMRHHNPEPYHQPQGHAKPYFPDNDPKQYNQHQDAKPNHAHNDMKPNLPPRPKRKPKSSSSGTGTGSGSSGGRVMCAALLAFIVLLGIIALILYLVYRPLHPRLTVTSFSMLSLSNSTTPFTSISTSAQVTILFRNPNRRCSISYDCLSVFLSYRNQAITYSTQLPALYQKSDSSMALSPVVGGGTAIPVAHDVMEGLMADESYGLVGLRLVVQGRVKFQPGPFNGRWTPLYVRCDLLLAAQRGFTGQMPMIGSTNCYVDP